MESSRKKDKMSLLDKVLAGAILGVPLITGCFFQDSCSKPRDSEEVYSSQPLEESSVGEYFRMEEPYKALTGYSSEASQLINTLYQNHLGEEISPDLTVSFRPQVFFGGKLQEGSYKECEKNIYIDQDLARNKSLSLLIHELGHHIKNGGREHIPEWLMWRYAHDLEEKFPSITEQMNHSLLEEVRNRFYKGIFKSLIEDKFNPYSDSDLAILLTLNQVDGDWGITENIIWNASEDEIRNINQDFKELYTSNRNPEPAFYFGTGDPINITAADAAISDLMNVVEYQWLQSHISNNPEISSSQKVFIWNEIEGVQKEYETYLQGTGESEGMIIRNSQKNRSPENFMEGIIYPADYPYK